jgi:hypothetical protein
LADLQVPKYLKHGDRPFVYPALSYHPVRAPRKVPRLASKLSNFAVGNLPMEPIHLLEVELKFIESGLY